MSENITSGQEKPQNSPSVQQTSSQQPMMQPAPTAYASAASIPAIRPKITALAMTAFIVSLACALLRLVEFGTMRSAMSSLQTVAAMNGGQSLRNYNTLESFVCVLYFSSAVPQHYSVRPVRCFHLPRIQLVAYRHDRYRCFGSCRYCFAHVYHIGGFERHE